MIHFLDAQTDQLVGYLDGGEEKNFKGDEIDVSVTGENRFTFTMPARLPEAKGIEDRQRVLVLHEKQGFQEFICYNSVQSKKDKIVITTGAELELDKLKIVPPGKWDGYTLRQYMELAVDGIDYEVGDVVGGQAMDLTFDDYLGGYEFLKRIATAFSVEFVFRTEIAGPFVTGRFVDAVEKIGDDSGKEFVNAKDLIDVQKEVFTDRYITALWVIAPPDSEGNPKPPVLVTDADAYQRWNRKGQHLYGVHVIESTDEEMTTAKMTELGRNELEKRIASVVQYTVEAFDLAPMLPHEAAYLGDRVGIIDEDFNPPLFASARIINIKRPVIRPDQEMPVRKTYTIGEVKERNPDDMSKKLAAMRKQFETIVAAAERMALEAQATANGVVDSERLQQLLDQKADAETVGEMVTNEQLKAVDDAVATRIVEAMKNLDLSGYATTDDVTKEVEKVQDQIKDANAYNLLKNSIGYGELDFWNVRTANTAIDTIMNDELLRVGFGAGFYFPVTTGTIPRSMEQIITVVENKPMTFSWINDKSVAGSLLIEIVEDDVVTLTVPDYSDPVYSFKSSYIDYTPTSPFVAIRITVAAAAEVTITGIMASVGSLPTQWTMAQGELYNAYVRTDERGLSVYRLDESGNVEGKSMVTPEEFAIYYKENQNSEMTRTFWFSKDETVTRKLRVLEEISWTTTKAIYIDSPVARGIAFVRRVSD